MSIFLGFLVSKFVHALSAARRSAGSAARYWTTVEAGMLRNESGSHEARKESGRKENRKDVDI